MRRFEDMEQQEKESLIKRYYSWLLEVPEEQIELEREIEYSFAPIYNDPYIYYPKLIGDLYKTDAMQKMRRISQFGIKIVGDGVSKQNRLDHCKHTAYLRLEESIYLWQQGGEVYNDVVEKNNLKKYLFAEEIKAALHDIGHAPFSHEMEASANNLVDEINFEYDESYPKASDFIPIQIDENKKGDLKVSHEDIGKMYIQNDKQINEILGRISGLKEALFTVIDQDVFNNKQHNEGNFDVDRKSYMLRDSLYYGEPLNYIYPIYKRLFFVKGTDKQILDSNDVNLDLRNIDIADVYENKDYEKGFEFLVDREKEYEERIYSPLCQVINKHIQYFLNTAYFSKDKTTKEIKRYIDTYLKLIKYHGLRKDDYDFFKSFDEIDMYSEILNIAQNSKDIFLKEIATMMLPEIRVFMDMIADMLGNDNRKDTLELSLEKKSKRKIVQQIYSLIEKDNELLRRIKSRNFLRENVIVMEHLPENVQNKYGNIIKHLRKKLTIYDKNEPLLFYDSNGEIKKFDEHSKFPEQFREERYIDVYYIIIPELLRDGWNQKDIDSLKADTKDHEYYFEYKPKISMRTHKTPGAERDHLYDFYKSSYDEYRAG